MNIIRFVQDKLGVTARREERLRRRILDVGAEPRGDLRPNSPRRTKMHPSNRPSRKWWWQ